MTRAALATVVAVLAGCGDDADVGDGRAVLEVEQRFEGRATYIEGSLSYVRLEGPTILEAQLEGGRTELLLTPGRYAIHSWQRPCSGNCDRLDSPTDRCLDGFDARPGDRLHASIVVRPGEGCTIEIR